jgi:hypothetical protein
LWEVAHDVKDGAIGIDDEKPANAPGLVGQRMDDLEAAFDGTCVDVSRTGRTFQPPLRYDRTRTLTTPLVSGLELRWRRFSVSIPVGVRDVSGLSHHANGQARFINAESEA